MKKKLTYWNYRILRHKHKNGDWFGIHEVFYDDKKHGSCTKDPIDITSEDIKGIKWMLKKMTLAVKKPVIDYDSFGEKK